MITKERSKQIYALLLINGIECEQAFNILSDIEKIIGQNHDECALVGKQIKKE